MTTVEDALDSSGEKMSVALAFAYGKYWAFMLVKLIVGIGYVSLISEGLRMIVPTLCVKLYTLPFLSSLRDYEETHALDLAPFVAAILFAFSSSLWSALLEAWLYDDAMLQATGRCPVRYRQCMLWLGGIILFADAALFYRAMTFTGWQSNIFSLSALLATLAYLAILLAVCLVSVNLKRGILSLKRG
jgi:hypothetical protein